MYPYAIVVPSVAFLDRAEREIRMVLMPVLQRERMKMGDGLKSFNL
jgi:hypothetical protein